MRQEYTRLGSTVDEKLDAAFMQSSQWRVTMTVIYGAVMATNGGLIGAFGPSLEALERSTGLTQAALGATVLQNRLAKLAGALLWGFYANQLQHASQRGVHMAIRPHVAMGACLVLCGMCSAILGYTTSGAALQAAMLVAGFSYGVTDSACNLMIMWVWQNNIRTQRITVALSNAMFTVGAFISPVAVAATIHYLSGAVWPVFHALALTALVEACVLPLLPSAPPPADPSAEVPEEHELMAPAAHETCNASPASVVGETGTTFSAPQQQGAGGSSPAEVGPGTQQDALSRRLSPEMLVMVAICTTCFFANGCEHAVATWLAPFGLQKHNPALTEESMAIMTSNFWTSMSMGRLAWTCFSGLVSSAWPALFFNTVICILSTACLLSSSTTFLWLGAVGVGLGVSSTFPASITLSNELGIHMTPRMMTILQLIASFGEMLCPFIIGLCFQARAHWLFGGLMLGWQISVLVVLLPVWLVLRRVHVKSPQHSAVEVTPARH